MVKSFESRNKKKFFFTLAVLVCSVLIFALAFLPAFTLKTSSKSVRLNAYTLMRIEFSQNDTSEQGLLVRSMDTDGKLKTAATFTLVALLLAGLTAVAAAVGLVLKKNFGMVLFITSVLCLIALIVAVIVMAVAGTGMKSEIFGKVVTNGLLGVGTCLMTVFAAFCGVGSLLLGKR